MTEPETQAPLVLVVEDSRTQAMYLRFVLEDAGCSVEAVESAGAALDFIASSLPDLLVTDLNLPDLSGDELCRRLRAAERSAVLPILMLTGSLDPDSEALSLSAGADAYALKDEPSPVFVARVRRLLKQG